MARNSKPGVAESGFDPLYSRVRVNWKSALRSEKSAGGRGEAEFCVLSGSTAGSAALYNEVCDERLIAAAAVRPRSTGEEKSKMNVMAKTQAAAWWTFGPSGRQGPFRGLSQTRRSQAMGRYLPPSPESPVPQQ